MWWRVRETASASTATVPAVARGVVRSKAIQRVRAALFLVILGVSTAGTAAAIGWWVREGVSWWSVVALSVGYVLSMIGVEVGIHRLAAHHAFKAPSAVRAALYALGSSAAQGPVLYWAANHRRHHKHSDEAEGDPHSPGLVGERRTFGGLVRAHLGWVFHEETTNNWKWAPDLIKDPLVARMQQTYWLWVLAGLAVPTALGLLLDGERGAIEGLLFGGFARLFFVNHVVWGVNSIGHTFGAQPFKSGDDSRNNVLLAVFGLGSGWHNNHHAFPSAVTTQVKAWQFDPCGWFVSTLAVLRLATDLQPISPELVERKRRDVS